MFICLHNKQCQGADRLWKTMDSFFLFENNITQFNLLAQPYHIQYNSLDFNKMEKVKQLQFK
jgi:hypothetical protein